MSEVILTSENFEATALQSEKPVLVDFWAPWCAPCKIMGPIVEEIAAERDDIVVGKLNVDDAPRIAERYNILSIPTFIIFKRGQVADQFSGTISREALIERIEKYV